MTEDGKGCEPCDTTGGWTPNGLGTKCLHDICTVGEFMNQDEECEKCPKTFLDAAKTVSCK